MERRGWHGEREKEGEREIEKNYLAKGSFLIVAFIVYLASESESCSVASNFAAPQIIHSTEFSRQNTGVGYHFLLQRIFLTPGIEPGSPVLKVDSLPSKPPETYGWYIINIFKILKEMKSTGNNPQKALCSGRYRVESSTTSKESGASMMTILGKTTEPQMPGSNKQPELLRQTMLWTILNTPAIQI